MRLKMLALSCIIATFASGSVCANAAPPAPHINPNLPTLFLIGDSTMRNHTPRDEGYGTVIHEYFNLDKINVVNRALGGRSSRSYYTEGLWAKVRAMLKPGDFVLMQFGHNDGGPIQHGTGRASIKGIGNQTVTIFHQKTGKSEVVHTYGWYLRKYVDDTEKAGAIAIIASPIPRDMWHGTHVNRNNHDYGLWSKEVAASQHAYFIDLNKIVAGWYDMLGPIMVKHLFPIDHTHTSPTGAIINADAVVQGLRKLTECPLRKYLKTEVGPDI